MTFKNQRTGILEYVHPHSLQMQHQKI